MNNKPLFNLVKTGTNAPLVAHGGNVDTKQPTITTPSQSSSNVVKDDNYYRYKAEKYHYKIQQKLKKDFVANNKPIPNGYEQYMKPFSS